MAFLVSDCLGGIGKVGIVFLGIALCLEFYSFVCEKEAGDVVVVV